MKIRFEPPPRRALEFIPLYPKPEYFTRTKITLAMTLSYKRHDYVVTDVILIDSS